MCSVLCWTDDVLGTKQLLCVLFMKSKAGELVDQVGFGATFACISDISVFERLEERFREATGEDHLGTAN